MKKALKLEILEKMITLIIAAFGFVAALAWNDAIQKLFELLFGKQSDLIAMFGYAIVVTALVVVLTIYFSKTVNRLKKELGLAEEDKK